MSNPAPTYIQYGAMDVYVGAPLADPPEFVDDAIDTDDWTLLGTSGHLDFSEEGLKITRSQELSIFRGQRTGPAAISRTSVDVMIGFQTADMTMPVQALAQGIDADVAVTADPGTLQVETLTVLVSTVTAGNANVVVTSANVTGSPVTVPVAVANNDTASQVATKVRTALGLVAAIASKFTIGGAGAAVVLTDIAPANANDATLNIAISNDTSGGVTTVATSANTTAGVESRPGYQALNQYRGVGRPTPVALLLRMSESPELSGGVTQGYYGLALQVGNPEPVASKTDPAMLAFKYQILEDPANGDDRMGVWTQQTAVALA